MKKLEQLEQTAKELLAEIEKMKGVVHKSESETMKEKYESGNYIAIFFHTGFNAWTTTVFDKPSFCDLVKWKLIHKKDKDILDAYLKDNSVEIEIMYLNINDSWSELCDDFIETYDENAEYRLKEKPKKWYEIESNFPCVVIEDDENLLICYNKYEWIDLDKHHSGNFRPATKEEILSLLVEP